MAIRLKDTASVNISGSAGSASSATKATQDASGNVITSTYATKSELTSGLSGKVDKVSGKGLSTNDFTTALKTKLEGLSNYDDTALTTAVNNLTTRFNTLLETDTTAAIESFNEIIAFLNGIADTETLEGIVAGIESQISTVEGKIPTKVSQLINDSGYVKNTAVATSSTLGLIKSGGDITVASDGTVSVANNSHTHTIANITNLQTALDGKASTAVATTSSAGLMSAEDKAALDGLITTGGEINQNAFSNVKVTNGSTSTTVAADSKTDTIELVAGSNVTLTPDATNDKVTISATNTNTTYTFAGGTNKFTVTPSGGSAQEVTVTPSIANNITGSGTSGYLTKFNGTNSVTNGPQLGSSTTTYLRNDGTWATPPNTTYSALSATDATAGTATTGRLITAKVLHDKITEMLPDEVTTTEGDTGLMTAADKSKLNGIAAGANKYTHPTYTSKSSGLYKITVDGTGHVSGTTAVAKSDITALGIPGSDTNTTYSFKGGTNKITVDPSNADAYDITITPSIANNITGSGTSGYIAKFNGANTVTNGPALGSSTSTYLRNDGTWATPPNSNTIPSAYCSTAAGTAAKAASCSGYVLTANTYLHLNLTAANSAQSALTLNVNSTGAKNIYINGSASSSSNYTLPAGTYVVFYDGTQFQLRTDGVLPGKILAAKNADTVNGLTVQTAVPANAKFTDNNTTYTFASGTNKFTVTPSGGSAQTVTVTPSISKNVTYTGTLVDEQVATFEGTSGTIKASGYTIAKSVPSNALFTDTNTKVTSVGNHYTPEENTDAAISASADSATNVTGSGAAVNVVTGLKRDAAGHVVGVTSAKIYSTDNNTTQFTITATATDDDVVVLTGTNGTNKVTFDAKHAKKGPSSGYTSGNTTTSISGSGRSGTIKVPQITVDSYGHVTAAADESVTITMPSVPVTSVAGKTGAVTLSKSDVGLGNVTNESKATMFTNAALTGTPTAPTAGSTTNTTQIATTAFVQSAIDAKLAANDAMIFKGTIGATSGKGYTVTSLPSTHNAGWTYKVAEAGTYAGVKCEIGDMIICITDGTSANNAHWTVVQNNIDGAVTGPASATSGAIALFDGTTGKIIKNSKVTLPSSPKFTDTTYSAGNGLTLNGTTLAVGAGTGISVSADAVGLATVSGLTAGTYGDDEATRTLTHSDVFDVPQITVDAYGRVTSASTKTLTLPASGNTDTKVTSVGNHYTPAKDSTLSADASSSTAATWGSTSLVTGVNIEKDSKGHVTGITLDSIRMPSNPNTNTTYTAGTGLSLSSTTFSTASALYTTASATTAATAGWYRIASSAASISNCSGIFQIVGSTSGLHTAAIITASTSYGVADSSSVSVIQCSQYSGKALTKVRIVYHTTYNSNYAYLEVYNPSATALPITVKMLGGTGWSLVTPSTAGSVPRGYSNKEVALSNGILGGHKHDYSGTTGGTTQGGTVGNATQGGTVGSKSITPAGTVSSSFTGTKASHDHSFTGTKHSHTFTGTAATSGGPSKTKSVYSITGVGSLPSCTFPTVNFPTVTKSYSAGTLTITHNAGSVTGGSFSAGSLPSRSSVTVASSDHTHSVTATGSISETTAGGTVGSKEITPAGSVSSSFTGTAASHNHSFTGSSHNHSFTGSSHTHTYSGTTAVPEY